MASAAKGTTEKRSSGNEEQLVLDTGDSRRHWSRGHPLDATLVNVAIYHDNL